MWLAMASAVAPSPAASTDSAMVRYWLRMVYAVRTSFWLSVARRKVLKNLMVSWSASGSCCASARSAICRVLMAMT